MTFSKIVFVFCIVFFSGFASVGQPLDVIYFKGGEVLRGRVMEYVNGDHLSILVAGQKVSFSADSLKNINKVKLFEGNYYQKEKGMWREFYVGLMSGKSSEYSKNQSHIALDFVNGYRFNRYLGLGLGTGYQGYGRIDIVPVFLSISGDLMNERVTPYYYFNAGYGFRVGYSNENEWQSYSEVKGGLMYNSGIGFKFRLKRTYIISSVAYRFQLARFITEQEVYIFENSIATTRFIPQVSTRKFNKVEFKIGIGF